ncbi:hypothetical protein HXX76_011443 [Chlamydomonas incerta]|uniref:Glutaredoxin-dependent peroxiredoxin n=1 Tax=Chlamydomonas incerta TaxID=51695 RepID=A0A835VUU6_CHLIN|nr:hypothetical protein HXX76_011443 [Chlamydomonas incerta]|eukprot:KAG2428740.1 hypothetical protein HXX76_011443 [Chlamydomonas incerta]
MTIAIGDKVPSATFRALDANGMPQAVTTEELFGGKKVLVFAVPGAFTPTCSKQHLPGFVTKADELKAKGVDTIACLSVNDAFVMGAWGQSIGVGDKVLMLADGAGAFTKAVGLDQDLSEAGLGVRSQRYAMLVEDGVVKVLNVEPARGLTCSSAESMLAGL